MPPSNSSRPTCLITGASSGIGHELAKLFAQDGCNLVLVARRESRLRELAGRLRAEQGVEVEVIVKDLAVASAPDQLYCSVLEKKIGVDMLVNNAGFATAGPFASSDLCQEMQLLQLNIVSLTHLTRLFLPRMVSQGSGRILNMASIAAYMAGPLMAAYYASKAYVLSFSEAIANELQGTGVTVTTLCPGPTRTEFDQRAKISDSRAFRGRPMDAATVARVGHDAMMKGKSVVICGFRNKAQMLPTKLMPRSVLAGFARKFNEVPPAPAPPPGLRQRQAAG